MDFVDEMDTREHQLLQATALLRHTLKTLYDFMVGRVTPETANQAFYAHDTKNVHKSVLRHFTASLAQLSALEDILSIDKFITDVASPAQDAELEARRQTMCALFVVTARAMAWPMHSTPGITAVAMNALDASVSRLHSPAVEALYTIPGVRELK